MSRSFHLLPKPRSLLLSSRSLETKNQSLEITTVVFFDNSAKLTDENEITPQTNYVKVYFDGICVWEPRYELSITHCNVDVTWFPFDQQVCNLTFESWLLNEDFLNLPADDESLVLNSTVPSESWHLIGTCCNLHAGR